MIESYSKTSRKSLALILLALLSLSGLCLSTLETVSAQGSISSITSYRAAGAPNYLTPGNESFWETLGWTNVSLAASVSPGGGQTSTVLVKSANDGFNIYVLFRWSDPVGPSFGSSSEIYQAPNGTFLSLAPEDTAQVKQLFYNSTYYYPDRVAMLWFLENATGRQQSPVMELGSGGALTGGAANIWHWQSVPTDNNPSDTGFPGGYTNPSGTPIFPADNLSFAEDDYTNTTGFFVIPGSLGANSPNLDPYADPYIVHVGSYFSDTSRTWTLEMVRSLTTPQASQYRVQLTSGLSYYVAFAVWNGKLGESSHIKSVSQWYNFTVSDQPAPLTPPPAAPQNGISATLAVATGLGLLIVGVIIGITVRPRRKETQT